MSSSRPKIVVLISGNGSNLQAIIDATAKGALAVDVALVVSNKTGAYGLTRAATAGIPTMTFPYKAYKDAGRTRLEYDLDLATAIHSRFAEVASSASSPDLIVLAGWMHILSADFLGRFPAGGIINLHPALPGAFDGAHAIERAMAAFKAGEVKGTGVMVHRVIAEVDRGEVVVVREVPINDDDTLERLEARIHSVEHELIVEGVRLVLGV